MPHEFDFYRVFCSTPGLLDDEQEAFLEVLGDVNEQHAVHTKRLFVPVVCLGAANTGAYNGAVRQNVLDADFFIQILGHSWGVESAEFEDLYDYAIECRDDAALRMRHVALLLKDLPELKLKSSVAVFRKRPGLASQSFRDRVELKTQLDVLLQTWLAELPTRPR